MTPEQMRAALDAVPGKGWFDEAEAAVRADPDALPTLFTRAGRKLGRRPLEDHPDWTPGQAGRVLLLMAVKDKDQRVQDLYWQGDSAERLAVLQALPLLDLADPDAGLPMLQDALRTNDTRLVAAALGPYAARLDAATWRQGVVKCVFMGVPLARVHALEDRADTELRAMLGALADERTAAGRPMPADATALLSADPRTHEAGKTEED